MLLVAGFDSQLKWAARLGDELARRGHRCRYVRPAGRSALSPEQIRATGVSTVQTLDRSELVTAARASDVVVLALTGPQVQDLVHALQDQPDVTPRPVVVTGWVGVIFEKSTSGYLDRSAADVVVVNGRRDLRAFEPVAEALGLPRDNLVLAGLPLLGPRPRPLREGPVEVVCFADQPTVPAEAAERLALYDALVRYARRHPDRRVLLKPRHRRGEDTLHHMQHHPEDLLAGRDLPVNLVFEHRPMTEVLAETDLLLTVSSTACLEALDHGCRVGLVLDLGVREQLGNHVFVDSGLLRTIDQLADDDIGTPEPDWLDQWFLGRDRAPAEIVADRVEELLGTGERPSAAALATPYHRALRDRPDLPPVSAGRSAWRRRRATHGPLAGTALHLGLDWTPPALQRPVRAWWRSRR